MSKLETLANRMRALLGLDLDFSINVGRDLLNPITKDLYLGSRPKLEDVSQLKEAGITHVVSCLHEDARAKVSFLEMEFQPLFIPMHDGMHEDIASTFPTFFEFIRAAREQQADAKVFVHCEAGVSRSATLTSAFLMQRSRKRFLEAYAEVRARRREVLPNIGFASQLQQLEFEMHPRAHGDKSPSSLARYLREICKAPVDVETLEDALQHANYDALKAIQAIFGDDIPRVIHGVRA